MRPQRVPFLLYGALSDSSPRAMDAPAAEDFAAHMALLAERGYTTMTVPALAALMRSGADVPPRAVAITFDGDVAAFGRTALPALQHHGFTATLYVSTCDLEQLPGAVARRARARVTPQQVVDIAGAGVEVGSHAHSRVRLDSLPLPVVRAQLVRSRDVLRDLGLVARTFSYPFGAASRDVRTEVVTAGFTSACGRRHAMSSPRDDVFLLSRITIAPSTSVAQLAALLSGHGLPTAPIEEEMRLRVWRRMRRVTRTIVGASGGGLVPTPGAARR